MQTQPGTLVTPSWTMLLHEGPERRCMVRDAQVAELVDDHIVDHLARRQHEAPVERECAARRARPPQRPLTPDPETPVGDADPAGLRIGDLCDQPPSPATPFR